MPSRLPPVLVGSFVVLLALLSFVLLALAIVR